MTSTPDSAAALLRTAGFAAALLGLSCGLAAAQSGTSITVRPPGGLQDRGPPPTLQEYPLVDRIFGFGGAVYPGYVDGAISGTKEARLSYLTGGGEGRMVFAAATVDPLCQMEEAPRVEVLDSPAARNVSVDLGYFTADRLDGGSRRCVGRQVEGVRVHYNGRAPRGGTSVTLRVSYPRYGRSYTHVVPIASR